MVYSNMFKGGSEMSTLSEHVASTVPNSSQTGVPGANVCDSSEDMKKKEGEKKIEKLADMTWELEEFHGLRSGRLRYLTALPYGGNRIRVRVIGASVSSVSAFVGI